jgi:CspA family cold shock protein
LIDDLEDLQHITGRVKWFDPAKGFGFVVSDEGGPDILLHVNVLRNFGQNSVADDARIEVMTHTTERGVQAVEILSIAPPLREESAGLRDLTALPETEVNALPLEPGRVKWFDKSKGFGFANIFGKPEDVFLHIEVLRQSGLSDVQPGEALAIRVIDGERGRMAAQVFPWEMGLPGAVEKP